MNGLCAYFWQSGEKKIGKFRDFGAIRRYMEVNKCQLVKVRRYSDNVILMQAKVG